MKIGLEKLEKTVKMIEKRSLFREIKSFSKQQKSACSIK